MTDAANFKESLKQQADIVRIVGDYVKLRKAGAQNYAGLCPFHSEKTPSFNVHAVKQFYHCFGCGVSGDVFSFIQKVENITFPEAVRAVAEKLGVPVPRFGHDSALEASDARLRAVLLEVQERACVFFQEYLKRPEGAHAREYLAGRGLNEETIRTFRIGFAPDSGFLLRDRIKGEFGEEALRESGLLSWKEKGPDQVTVQPSEAGARKAIEVQAMYSKFRNRVMFPITNESGRVIAFTGRTLSTDEKAGPKYLNSPETPVYSKSRVLFNLDRAKEAVRKLDYAILVEGQMDCISVYAAGFHNVIASSGTAFTDMQAKLLGRSSKKVVVNFDPDTAGANATERTLGLLVEEDFNIQVLTLEQGFDPDLFIRRKGKEAYAAALRGSQKYFDYLIERARQRFPVRSAEGKVKAVNYLLPHLQRVPSRIARDELSLDIAQKLGIDSAVLRQELKHAAATRSAAAVRTSAHAQVTEAERILVRALASACQMKPPDERSSSRSGVEDEFDPARQVQFALESGRLHEGLAAESLLDALLNSGSETADVMDLPLSEADRNLLAAVLIKDEEELTADLVGEAIRKTEKMQVQRKLEQVQQQLQSTRSDDREKQQELSREKDRLTRRKRALAGARSMGPEGTETSVSVG